MKATYGLLGDRFLRFAVRNSVRTNLLPITPPPFFSCRTEQTRKKSWPKHGESLMETHFGFFFPLSLSHAHTLCYNAALPNQCRLLLFSSYYPIIVVFTTVVDCRGLAGFSSSSLLSSPSLDQHLSKVRERDIRAPRL